MVRSRAFRAPVGRPRLHRKTATRAPPSAMSVADAGAGLHGGVRLQVTERARVFAVPAEHGSPLRPRPASPQRRSDVHWAPLPLPSAVRCCLQRAARATRGDVRAPLRRTDAVSSLSNAPSWMLRATPRASATARSPSRRRWRPRTRRPRLPCPGTSSLSQWERASRCSLPPLALRLREAPLTRCARAAAPARGCPWRRAATQMRRAASCGFGHALDRTSW